MTINDLYLIKGKLSYKGKEYTFKTLKLVRLKDLSEYKPTNIQVFTQFDSEKTYIFDEKYNQFVNFEDVYFINIPGIYWFSIYTLTPIYALINVSENTNPVILNALSKSNFAYKIETDTLKAQYHLITIYKYAFLKFITTFGTLRNDILIIFYNYDSYLPHEIINQKQIFDWDIIELC